MRDYLFILDSVKEPIKNENDLLTVKLNLGRVKSGIARKTLEIGSTNYYKRYAEQFIYGKQNFFNGGFGIIPNDMNGKFSSGDVPSLNIKNIDKNFLYFNMSRPDYWKSKESYSTGTGSKCIHEKTLLNFDINVTQNCKEQEKIRNIFSCLEKQITFNEY